MLMNILVCYDIIMELLLGNVMVKALFLWNRIEEA